MVDTDITKRSTKRLLKELLLGQLQNEQELRDQNKRYKKQQKLLKTIHHRLDQLISANTEGGLTCNTDPNSTRPSNDHRVSAGTTTRNSEQQEDNNNSIDTDEDYETAQDDNETAESSNKAAAETSNETAESSNEAAAETSNGTAEASSETVKDENGTAEASSETVKDENGTAEASSETVKDENGTAEASSERVEDENGTAEASSETVKDENETAKDDQQGPNSVNTNNSANNNDAPTIPWPRVRHQNGLCRRIGRKNIEKARVVATLEQHMAPYVALGVDDISSTPTQHRSAYVLHHRALALFDHISKTMANVCSREADSDLRGTTYTQLDDSVATRIATGFERNLVSDGIRIDRAEDGWLTMYFISRYLKNCYNARRKTANRDNP